MTTDDIKKAIEGAEKWKFASSKKNIAREILIQAAGAYLALEEWVSANLVEGSRDPYDCAMYAVEEKMHTLLNPEPPSDLERLWQAVKDMPGSAGLYVSRKDVDNFIALDCEKCGKEFEVERDISITFSTFKKERFCPDCSSPMFSCDVQTNPNGKIPPTWNCTGCGRTLHDIPTGEYSQTSVDGYWEEVLPTYIENWPEELQHLSLHQVSMRLPMAKAFLKCFEHIMDGKELSGLEKSYLSALQDKMDRAVVGRFADGFFVRLGSRSPKDSWRGYHEGFKCFDGDKALRLLLDSPDRIYDDVALAHSHGYAPTIFFREWTEIPRWSEFRCFMQDKRLVGISQYDHLRGDRHDEICENSAEIEGAIHLFFEKKLLPVIHLPSVVFDVWIDGDDYLEANLLEINPFSNHTDPCLFHWKEPFDGSFRFITEQREKPDIDALLERLGGEES